MPQAPDTPRIGVVEVEISGLGSAKLSSSSHWLKPMVDSVDALAADPSARRVASARAKALANLDAGLDLKLLSAGFVDVGTRGSGGVRYIAATYQVRNARYCATAGQCAAYADARQNLTFLAVATSGTVAQSAVSRFVRFDGSAADPALATQLWPTHGMNTTATAVDSERASLQIYHEHELPAADPSASAVMPYGFVVRNVHDGGRTLPASPAADQFDGRVTFAFRIPLQPIASDDPYKISLRFQVTQDSATRVTQSAEEATSEGDTQARMRAVALGGTDVAVPCTRLSQQVYGNPICRVRLAGPSGAGTAHMGSAPSSPRVLASPSHLSSVARDGPVVLGISELVANPSEAAWVVWGSQSGPRRLSGAYSGSVGNGAGNQLVFRLGPTDRRFFAGETVSFTATSSVTASAAPAAALTAFSGSLSIAGSSPGSSGALGAAGTVSVPGGPYGVVAGDLNRDGHLDLVTTNHVSHTVSILLGDGAGGFVLRWNVSVGLQPANLALGDLDGDGLLDAAVAAKGSNQIAILAGTGDGRLSDPLMVAVGQMPYGLALGDVNGDGRLDIVAANLRDATLSVLLRNDSGGFTEHGSRPAVGAGPASVALGDFNRDGKLDVVTANLTAGTVSLLLGDGAGGFAAASHRAAGNGTVGLAVGDLNGDGLLDVAAVNYYAEQVVILPGDGNGALGAATAYAVGSYPYAVAPGDFNGDGRLDLAVVNDAGGSVSVLLAQPSGGFGAAVHRSVGSRPQGLTVGDIDGDGRLDVVTANYTGPSVSVLRGQ